jgi:hypothetical protein
MKKSTSFPQQIKSLCFVVLFAVISNSTLAAVHYVRTANDATSWNAIPGADIISSDTPSIIPTDTYYFAKGTFTLTVLGIDPITLLPVPVTPSITTGAIYGGFSGSETVINLAQRMLSDKDANGMVEPWEFTNETILKGSTSFDDLTGSRIRLLTVTGGEVNGVTFSDHYYYGELSPATPYSGAIFLGVVTSNPGLGTDLVENAGKMRFCTVKRVKAGANGPIFMTNSNSIIDNCLIEECNSVGSAGNGGGGAVYMYPFGGTISNSVLRNNVASAGVPSSGRGGAIYSVYNTVFTTVPNKTIIQNCAIYNNTAGGSGGALRIEGKNSATLNLLGGQVINCTIANNLTQGSGVASAELIFDGQLMLNTIVVGDAKDEIRPQANNNYYSNCIYGTKNGSIVMTPGTDLVSGKVTADLKFQKIANFVGAMTLDDLTFDQATYDAIRSTSLKIVDETSPAVTTLGLTSMPTTFSTNANIIPTATITATDLAGVTRTGNHTIGAYQYVAGLATKTFKLNAYAVVNGIVINESLGKTASVYNVSGQLVKKVSIHSNEQIIDLVQGFYLVTVGNAVGKIIVK